MMASKQFGRAAEENIQPKQCRGGNNVEVDTRQASHVESKTHQDILRQGAVVHVLTDGFECTTELSRQRRR